jgi:hypothetical protein
VHSTARLLPLIAIGTLVAACGERHWSVHRAARLGSHRDANTHLPLRIASDLVVRRAEFGVLETGPDGEERFAAADQVPAEDGQVFGWVVEVETSRSSVRWQEHLRLPGPVSDWGDVEADPDVVLSHDGRSALAQGEELVEDGELSRFYWSLASGDPGGAYELDLAIEGRPVAHFSFRVPETVREKAILVKHGGRPPHARGTVHFVPVAAGRGAKPWR